MTATVTPPPAAPPPDEPQEPPAPAAGSASSRAGAVVSSVLFPLLAIVTALVAGALVIVFTDPDALEALGTFFDDPGGALDACWEAAYGAYRALVVSSLGSSNAIGRTINETTPLILAGLSVALAFRAGLFNIGGAGQLMMGAAASGYVGITFDLPAPLHVPLAVAAGIAGGAVWGGIAGFLKARTGAHEVISTIMLNFVALRLLDYLLTTEAFRREGRLDPISEPVRPSGRLSLLPEVPAHAGIFLALAAAGGVWWLLNRSTVGFRMRAVGANPHAARAAGMSVAGTYLLSMALAGALAGLAGTANVLGVPRYSLTGGFYSQIGFDAIALALVGRSKPAGVVGAAVLFGILRAGSVGMQAQTQTPTDIIVVIQALIIAFVAAPALVQAIWRIRARRATDIPSFAGWG